MAPLTGLTPLNCLLPSACRLPLRHNFSISGGQKKMRRTMREVFGLERMRPGQAEVIRSVISGHDTLAVMPTGAGKSLCYQLPALHLPGTTVIVSPLISLMKDQVDKLSEAGVEAAQVNSALTEGERH